MTASSVATSAACRSLLLHHKGAKSGMERIAPLASQPLDDGWAVFASKGGADDNPAWYHNVLANPGDGHGSRQGDRPGTRLRGQGR